MKCTSMIRGSHLKKQLGFAGKSLKSHGVNSDKLYNWTKLASKRGIKSLRLRFKYGLTSQKKRWTAPKNTKNLWKMLNFGELPQLLR